MSKHFHVQHFPLQLMSLVTTCSEFYCISLCNSLYRTPVLATDLRAEAALVLAGMAAEGTTHIEGVR